MTRHLRAAGTIATIAGLAIALSGCIAIKSQSSSQRLPGVISLIATICASDRDRDVTANCDADAAGRNVEETDEITVDADDAVDPDDGGEGQLLVGFRVPDGSAGPESFPSVAQDVTFSRSPSYTSQLTTRFPPAAGTHWEGYISTVKTYKPSNAASQTTSFRPEFTLPPQPDGEPFAGPYRFRIVAGFRLANAAQAGSAVVCDNSTTFCIDSPTHARVPTNLSRATSDFGVLAGGAATAGHGETATVSFPVRYVDAGSEGPQTLALAATTNVPGSSATPSATSLTIAPDTTSTVNVAVPVPAATPLGSYTVTLSAATGSPAVTRSSTATVQVVDELAPSVRLSSPAEGSRVVIGRTVAADYACSDETNGAGLKSCEAPVPSGAPIDTGSLGAKTFAVTAADNAGNTASATRTYTVVPRSAPAIRVVFNFAGAGRATRFTSLVLRDIPRGSKVTATCRPKQRARRCPAKRFTKRDAKPTLRIRRFERKRFAPGTVIDLRVTRADSVGAVKLLTIRAGKAPAIATRCLPLGARTPQRRC